MPRRIVAIGASFMIIDPVLLSQGLALVQVIFIDLVMAGDNAVAVGIAAAGLPVNKRRLAILYGLIGAVVLRIAFVLLTVQLLAMTGLLLAGGLLLLWVCWKMWHELRHDDHHAEAHPDGEAAPDTTKASRKPKTLLSATLQILAADLSMSLDNVLAVAGAAQHHVPILVFGLLLSIAAMGVAANLIATVLHKHRWIAYVGLAVVLFVAGKMIWEGSEQLWHAGHCDISLQCVPATIDNLQNWLNGLLKR